MGKLYREKLKIPTLIDLKIISIYKLTNYNWHPKVCQQSDPHNELKIQTLLQLAYQYYKKLHSATTNHPNPLISNFQSISNPINSLRRLKQAHVKIAKIK
jgi:hypothetical protein